jgi:hypothetical protein
MDDVGTIKTSKKKDLNVRAITTDIRRMIPHSFSDETILFKCGL